jgi:hypothetical protein
MHREEPEVAFAFAALRPRLDASRQDRWGVFESRITVPVNFPSVKLRRAVAAVWVAELFR